MDFKVVLVVFSAVVLSQAQPAIRPQIPSIPGSSGRIIPSSPGGNRMPTGPRTASGQPRSSSNGQPSTGPNNTPVMCASTGRSVISQCFQSNGGIQMQYVIALLSNGTQRPLPRNAEQIKSSICTSESNIITCVFNGVNGLRNGPRCTTRSEYVRLEQETVGLISGVQQLCGKGPLPPPSSCLRDLNKNLQTCYSQVGLNPDLFTPSGSASGPPSASKVIGAVIGENSKVAAKFCRMKKRLFDCMKTTLDKCPGSVEVMALSGYDHQSLQKGIDVLCHDVDVYVQGLQCFQKPTPEVTQCYNTMVEKVTELTSEQLKRSMPLDQFYSSFCQLRVRHMDCDIQAWSTNCNKSAVGLKNEFECNLLPTRCKNNPALHERLQRTCAIKQFHRQLRSGTVRHVSMSGMLLTLFSIGFLLIL